MSGYVLLIVLGMSALLPTEAACAGRAGGFASFDSPVTQANRLLSPNAINAVLAVALGLVVLLCALAYCFRARLLWWADRLGSFFTPEEQPTTGVLWPLFLLSVATLYIEIMLIRWIGTEVRIFAYFQNLALIACFLGFGLGCYWSTRRRRLPLGLFAMAVLITLAQAPIGPWKRFLATLSNLLSLSSDAALWGFLNNLPTETVLLLFAASVVAVASFLLLLVAVMVPLGQWVGFYLDMARNPISGYSVNLFGSVVGIWIFAGMAFLWLPPEYWFALAFLLFLVIGGRSWPLAVASLILLVGILVLFRYARTSETETYWSPYQKLEVVDLGDRQYRIEVNNTGYMTVANLTPDFLAHNPQVAERYRDQSSYDVPFRFARHHDRVLIVGAGAGNDAAAALRNGASQVDAVEIDPVIYSLGERLHPEQPYGSPKVRKFLNDARAFLRETQGKYDIIVFGLLDSHTQFSDYSNMRIDNYVYTEEAFREARRLLKPEGILVVKFEVRAPWTWMGQRFYWMLDHIYSRPPIVFSAPSLGNMASATIFITSDDASLWARAAQPQQAALTTKNPPPFPLGTGRVPPLTTDDWPYVYHRSRSIPRTYFVVSLILLGMAVLLVRKVLEPRQASTWHFFFLGAGFLLLETQLIGRLALYFGTTWVVNCLALTAILSVLMVANLYVAHRRPSRLGSYYVLLLTGLFANYFFPWHHLSYGARTVGVLLSIAYSFPLFFAGVVFAETFRCAERKSNAFGANIVGAVTGGLVQNISFIVGIKALLLVAALFYAFAGLCALIGASEKVCVTPAAEA